MSANTITISPSRHKQIIDTITRYVSNWHLTLDSDEANSAFLSSYSPTIYWYDHAFLIQRVGHSAVLGLHAAFNHCNQPFRAEVKFILPTITGAVVEQVWHGRCANDVVRPDGQVAVKASGKDFVCHVCMVVEIGEDGKINRIDEYYNRRWDDGVAEREYAVMKGPSAK